VTGHGLLRLSNALHFADEDHGRELSQSPYMGAYDFATDVKQSVGPKVYKGQTSSLSKIGQNGVQTFYHTVTKNATFFSATLAWNDAASTFEGETNPLTFDFDLRVTSPGCDTHTGNEYLQLHTIKSDSQYPLWSVPLDQIAAAYEPRNGIFTDFRNNVERVYLENPPAGLYTIQVLARAGFSDFDSNSSSANGGYRGFAMVANSNGDEAKSDYLDALRPCPVPLSDDMVLITEETDPADGLWRDHAIAEIALDVSGVARVMYVYLRAVYVYLRAVHVYLCAVYVHLRSRLFISLCTTALCPPDDDL
jgi:hypothetical protein